MLVSLELLAASSDIAQSTHAFASCAAHSGSHAGLRFLSLIFDQPAGSIFAPQATPARSIFSLSLLVLGICGAIFLIVAGLLLFTLIRYRHRRGYTQREPAQIYGSTQIELSWTVIPILIVVVLFLATARVIFVTQTAAKPATPSTSSSSAINIGGSTAIRNSASSPPTNCTFPSATPKHPRRPI